MTTSHWKRGEEPNQAVTLDDTIGSRIGNDVWPAAQERADGFLLQGDCSSFSTCELAVFVADLGEDGCRLGVSAAVAGFAVNGDLKTLCSEAAVITSAPPSCGASQ
jgi:hypothetical protein